MNCIFCSIDAGQAHATFVRSWSDVIAIRPLNPVTAGHLLVIPHSHVADVGEALDVSGYTMAAAAELAAELPAANIITNKGQRPRKHSFTCIYTWCHGARTMPCRCRGHRSPQNAIQR